MSANNCLISYNGVSIDAFENGETKNTTVIIKASRDEIQLTWEQFRSLVKVIDAVKAFK